MIRQKDVGTVDDLGVDVFIESASVERGVVEVADGEGNGVGG